MSDQDFTMQNGMRRRATPKQMILGIAALCAIIVYLSWRLLYTLPMDYGVLAMALGILLFSCELASGVESIINYSYFMYSQDIRLPSIPESWYPHVDVLIATHNEDARLLHATINGAIHMDYPDKSKVHIYVCDDNNREEIRKLAECMGVGYIGMPPAPGAKAANINNALRKTNSPLVACLDADMIPRRQFLTSMVPYFFLPRVKQDENGNWVERRKDEIDPKYKIGFVQAPQSFYNPDLFQFNLYAEARVPNEQMYFFRDVNVGMNSTNTTILCGTNNIISREALEKVGLFAVDCITEDMLTGLKIQGEGYTTFSVDKLVASGLSPNSIPSLLRQRERWGRGGMQVMHKVRIFFTRRYRFVSKISYFNTFLYWWTFFRRYIFTICPILVVFFDIFIVDCSLMELLIFWLPYWIIHTTAMNQLTKGKRTVHWNNVIDTTLFPYLMVPVMLETFGIRMKKFYVTPKKHSKKRDSLSLAIPHILLLIMSVACIVLSILFIIQTYSFYNIIILVWLVVNTKNLVLAFFFMMGRNNIRFNYRLTAAVPAEIEYGAYVYKGTTIDISEGGYAIAMRFPAYIPLEEPVTVRLKYGDICSVMRCVLVQVNATPRANWAYSFRLQEIAYDQLEEFKQIIYDRAPGLPVAVNETLPVIEDLMVNFNRRFGKQMRFFSRKLPRVFTTCEGFLEDGARVSLVTFNYHYVTLYPLDSIPPDQIRTLTLEDGVVMKLAAPEEHLARQARGLCRVVNWEDFVTMPDYVAALAKWAQVDVPEKIRPQAHRLKSVEQAAFELVPPTMRPGTAVLA